MDYKNLARIFNVEGQNPHKALSLGLIGIISGFVVGNMMTTPTAIPTPKKQPTAVEAKAPTPKPANKPTPTNTYKQAEAKRKREQKQKQKSRKVTAQVCAKQRIEDMLKAPGTAKHPWFSTNVTPLSDSKFLVSSYVDAENSFGAMLRQNYVCIVEISGVDALGYDDCNTECEFE